MCEPRAVRSTVVTLCRVEWQPFSCTYTQPSLLQLSALSETHATRRFPSPSLTYFIWLAWADAAHSPTAPTDPRPGVQIKESESPHACVCAVLLSRLYHQARPRTCVHNAAGLRLTGVTSRNACMHRLRRRAHGCADAVDTPGGAARPLLGTRALKQQSCDRYPRLFIGQHGPYYGERQPVAPCHCVPS